MEHQSHGINNRIIADRTFCNTALSAKAEIQYNHSIPQQNSDYSAQLPFSASEKTPKHKNTKKQNRISTRSPIRHVRYKLQSSPGPTRRHDHRCHRLHRPLLLFPNALRCSGLGCLLALVPIQVWIPVL